MDNTNSETPCCPAMKYLLRSLLLISAILLWKSSKFHYYAKMTVLSLSTIFISWVLIFPYCLFRRDYRNALNPSWGVRTFIGLLGNTFEVQGTDNINVNKGGVVLINHQSILDISAHLWPLIGVATAVSRKLIMFAFPPSYFWGTLFIDKTKPGDAQSKLNKEALAINEQNAKLLIFPEGTRHGGNQLLPFKKGPFHIAIQSQSVLVPVVVQRYTFLDSTKKIFGSGHSIIKILPEIDCKGLTKNDLPQLMARTQSLMQSEYDALNKRA